MPSSRKATVETLVEACRDRGHAVLAGEPGVSDAVALIHEETHGHLREVDRVATDALKLAARRKLRAVDRELVVRVFGEQEAATED